MTPRDGLILLLVAQVAYKLIDLGWFAIMSRVVPGDAFGTWLWWVASLRGALILAGWNAWPLASRQIAAPGADPGPIVEGLWTFRLATALPWLTLTAGFGWMTGQPTLPLLALALLMEDIFQALATTWVARGRPWLNVIVGLPVHAAWAVLTAAAASQLRDGSVLVPAQVLRGGALIAAGWWLSGRPGLRPLPGWLRGVLPFTLFALAGAATDHLDTALLGWWGGGLAVLPWTLAARVSGVVAVVPAVFMVVGLPAQVRHPDPGLILRHAVALAALGALWAAAVALVGGPVCDGLFGPHGAEAASVLLPLACLAPLQLPSAALLAALQARGQEEAALRWTTAAAALGLCVAACTIPGLGWWGAVLGRSVGAAALLGGLTYPLTRAPSAPPAQEPA